jgi:hypothetical protein
VRFRKWLAVRGPAYVYRRARMLLSRYGITPSEAMDRVQSCVSALTQHGCAPTLPTPGRVVQRYPRFMRQLQSAGAEIAVHSYDHVNLAARTPNEARRQLVRAAEVFAHHGIEVYGFRCPYLSATDDLLDAVPAGVFDYSSNKAVWWDVDSPTPAQERSTTPEVLHRLYKPTPAVHMLCTPRTRPNLIEIPVSLPDDLELHDGLGLDLEGMTQAWSEILHRTHQRGELFNLVFHPELARSDLQPLVTIVLEAKRLQPPVWIARLRDVSNWWREKSGFGAVTSYTPAGLRISFSCSERATILVKGLETRDSGRVWDGMYREIKTKELHVPADSHPLVGLPADAPEGVVSFLREQGYILDTGETAPRCGTYIDAATLARLAREVELVHHIEASTGPLVRYWRWPDGAKSAMCITGDLDALTLLDYAYRLFAR